MSVSTNDTATCKERFNCVYDETFDEIKLFVAAKCADPSYVSDIIQETYCEFYGLLLRHGSEYADNPRALVYSIAKRRVYRYYSLKQKLSRLVPLFNDGDGDTQCCVPDEAVSGEVDDNALDAMEAERIWDIINTYPADTRKIMYLYFNCGLSHSQIAQSLGCSLSNVKNRLYRTLAEIRKTENSDE